MVGNGVHLAYLVSEDWYFLSHRLPVARAAREAGYHVTVITNTASETGARRIREEGFDLASIALQRGRMSPLSDLRYLLELTRMYRELKPDLVHQVALKPVLYGSIAATLARLPRVINAMAGMGHLYQAETTKAKLLRAALQPFLRFLLGSRGRELIVQNEEDEQFFHFTIGLARNRIHLIRGSGVDPARFRPHARPATDPPEVILASRLLYTKGVKDYVHAARRINTGHTRRARFLLAGKPDTQNPQAIPQAVLRQWHESGVIEWLGPRDDIPALFARASIVVLPTRYREGVPKVLIEAAAAARAIVTTDTPGCHDIVRDGQNGLLVPPGNVDALTAAIARLLDDPGLAATMGRRGRSHMLTHFSVDTVVEQTLALYQQMATPYEPTPTT